MREMNDNEVKAGHTSKKLWPLPRENPAAWQGEDISSKTIIWRHNLFVAQGMKAYHVTRSATGHEYFNFNSTLFHVTENEVADTILMITKIGQHTKTSSLIGHKF